MKVQGINQTCLLVWNVAFVDWSGELVVRDLETGDELPHACAIMQDYSMLAVPIVVSDIAL